MVAISLEVILLVALLGFMLLGLWLMILDLGLKEKYRRVIIMLLITVGSFITVFFIAHLIAFYPTI
jgi:hypothetical protein